VPFDVVLFPDGVTAPDRVSAADLTPYQTLVVPDCHALTPGQAEALRAALDAGTTVVVTDRFGDTLPPAVRDELLGHPGARTAEPDDLAGLTPHGRQLEVAGPLGANIARLPGGGAAAHLVNYGFDESTGDIAPLRDVRLTVRLPFAVAEAVYHPCDGPAVRLSVAVDGDAVSLTLPSLGVYGIVALEPVQPARESS
jgi:hypothetical protein